MTITDFDLKRNASDLAKTGEKRSHTACNKKRCFEDNATAPLAKRSHTAEKSPLAEREREHVTISFEQINPDTLAYAPIHFYLGPWCDGRYSRQCLRRMLTNVIDQESWHALKGVEEHRALHASNCTLIECLLAALDERESERAA